MLSRILFALGGLVLVAAGIAAVVLAGRLQEQEEPAPPLAALVEVGRPERAAVPPAITETGFVRAAERIEVATEISGRIVEIGAGFRLGSRVAEGDLLIRLEARTVETEIARAEADLGSAEAAAAQATAQLLRREELAEDNFAAEADLERARADAAAAKAGVEQARAALEAARLRLDDTRLRAPFDALVVAEDASTGQLLQVGTSIGTLVSADVAEVRVGLNEQDLRRLRRGGDLVGRQVQIQHGEGDSDDGGTLMGTISALSPVLEGAARTVEIVVQVADPFAEGRELVLNALVTATIPLPESDDALFRLPSSALQSGDRLWRVTAENTLEEVPATVRRRGEGEVFVTSDVLGPDDRILLTELSNPLPGLEVRVRGASDGDAGSENGRSAEAEGE